MFRQPKNKKKKFVEVLTKSANKIWMAGLGALNVSEHEGVSFFKTLVEKGEEFEKMGLDNVKRLGMTLKESVSNKSKERTINMMKVIEDTKLTDGIWKSLENKLEEKISDILKRTEVPTGQEIADLKKRVEELHEKIDKLN